ncbi:MAG: efflux RND transporter periplasmic adaptor subunit [Cyclobacteriaceae bacterium]|nr:efflux RND transporter periplasmic adaptor subunit [Cyclobacteriaceae bacterium]MDH4297827.1 efflux RND transporter periplasmic adaptor subunit [Cyclobacteriaceae bacterium]MDH5251195.1 efflux RND transporter periplasmic adaptor subunit [Cyclobacteriaceae bacterium]
MKYTIVIIGAVLIASCGQQQPENKAEDNASVSANKITLTANQYKAIDITLGKITRKEMGTSLVVNGKLDVPPQSMVTIAAPMGGFVKSTHLLSGMKVKKGEVLATMENQEYIQLQQDYLDNRSKLEFSKAEYTRQTELAKENINAQKTLQQAKAQYESARAAVQGLEAKLAMINISAHALSEGSIRPSINLYSPINGFVTEVNVNAGQYVNATNEMFKIVNIDHIHAELQIFEKDIHKISIGQKVSLKLAYENKIRNASVFLVGKEISPERTVGIHCHLEEEDPGLLPGMYITATIETSLEEVDVLPASAVVSFEGDDFIFTPTEKKEQFEIVKVKIGSTSSDIVEVEVPQGFDKNRSIVTKGTFELLGILKNMHED